jgi:C1A family cysteine protease
MLNSVPLSGDGVEDAIEDTLESQRPVVLTLEITDEFDNPSSTGEIAVPAITAQTGAYHAVLVVGADQRRSVRHFLIRNSWGPYWGLGGYGWLPVGYTIAFAVQAGAIDLASITS